MMDKEKMLKDLAPKDDDGDAKKDGYTRAGSALADALKGGDGAKIYEAFKNLSTMCK